MARVVIFGNSGSGKSTLATRMAKESALAHLDLDTLAWEPVSPPVRRPVAQSCESIKHFMNNNKNWIIEGCYSDLLAFAMEGATKVIYLCLPIEHCVENAKSRPWEPHKYESKEAQDANLDMLIHWIRQYENRNDTFSKTPHEQLFSRFSGQKVRCISNDQIV
ncbi:AAA family ATPase [Alteromonas ponticola]|uniref:AAA family ATPase n=1 Tax=Alteromonas ponticola TaxID=2720613 RepID=A0ABX1R3U5_9ALTE|nr:AAA family ATPase [Alteromonas ponticola]NMH60331.1 AAA family ATPase [Alteromonas ponticola]